MQRRTFQTALGFALTLAAISVPQMSLAQAWPTKQPIKLVAVFPPGGSVDQVARIIAQPLQQQLGQTVIVENRGGASGVIGTAAVVQAPADGYTFAVVFDTHGVNPSLNPSMPFDSKKDLIPLVLVGTSPMVLATNVNSEYKTFADVINAAKAKKNVSFGSIGNGSLGHLAMALLGKDANVEWTHVPYKGGGPLMSDAVAGHVPLSIGSVFVTKPHIDSGRMRPLAVTTTKRAADLPNVPTIAENGYAGFEAPAWWALLASAKTPPEIVKRLQEESLKALKSSAVTERFATDNAVGGGGPSSEYAAFIKNEQRIWSDIVKRAGIKPD